MCWLRRIAALFLLLAAGGCGDLPQPFGHTPQDLTGTRRSILQLPDSGGIAVHPVINGATPEISAALVKAMVKALGDANVPASAATSLNRWSYQLEGRLTAAPVGSMNKVLILWLLTDAEGKPVGEHLQHEAANPRDWQRASSTLLTQIAQRGAPAIAAFIQEKGVTPVENALKAEIQVLPVEGAPGDGQISLTRAVRHFLIQSKVKVVEAASNASVPSAINQIKGIVHVGPPRGGNQPIQVVWKVLRPDGSEVGRAEQGNFVPTGALDGPWSDIAYLIAEAATPAIMEILARTNAPAGSLMKPPGSP